MQFLILYDDRQEGEWFRSLSSELSGATLRPIGATASNSRSVMRLLRYDRPDIIFLVDGEPRLVIEKTSEVPTGHNVGQRFARIANAVEERIMFVCFFPFKAMKHGTYANVCYVNARLFRAFERMEELHEVPVLAVDWPCDSHYELIRDGSEDADMKALVNDFFEHGFQYGGLPAVDMVKRKMKAEYDERLEATPSYAEPPPTVKISRTTDYIASLKTKFDGNLRIPQDVLQREETLVYRFDMTPENCRREDPYTGTQFIYDYIWCRNGPSPRDKYRNLVLTAPLVPKKRWLEANPNDPARKSSLYYATANFLVLKDGVLLPEETRRGQLPFGRA
jgi:hypothetical protein